MPVATSRRHFIACAALLGSAVATNVIGIEDAHATGRRFRIRRRIRRRIQRRRNRRRQVVCFVSGTLISTPHGEVPIEQLNIGDLINTSSGDARPVKWLARRQLVRPSSGIWPKEHRPIKIERHAIDGHSPRRDLYVSSGHHMYLDGMLIPVAQLVNGLSITECAFEEAETIDYFHIELDEHAVIFADGAATETLMASPASRATFDNLDEYLELYGVNDKALVACAPVIAYWGGRGELLSRLRSIVAPVIDRRDPRDIARDRLMLAAIQAQQCGGARLNELSH
ncbi:MAG: Hint domain-containing protein [Pseudomonadota bacterium]